MSYASYSSYSSSYSSSSYGDADPCAASAHRRLGGGDDDGFDCPDPPPLTLFDFAFHSRSDYVVYSFVVIVAFTILAELCLDHLEEVVSSVYHKVLQKMYKELMLLGLISFGLFIASSSLKELDEYLLHSFEFAHLVLFFVGCLLVAQTVWTVFCNREIKKRVWVACNADWQTVLEPRYERTRHASWYRFSSNFAAIQLQLFRHCFLEVFDLPQEFSFPHYLGMSLDAHTVELVDVLPSSYAAVLLAVLASEFAVRFQGPSESSPGHWRVTGNQAVFCFAGAGLALCLAQFYMYRVASSALMNVLRTKFGVERCCGVGFALEEKLRQDTERQANAAGGKLHRSFAAAPGGRRISEVQATLRPFLDRGYFEGAETEVGTHLSNTPASSMCLRA